MFIGHWAPALAAVAVSRRAPSLGMAFIGAQLVDWGFFTLALFDVEQMLLEPGITAMNPFDLYHMPYTHSLTGTTISALAFAVFIWFGRRDLVTGLWGFAIVMSHWALDLLVHRPDLTIAGGEDKFGFGLWNYPWIAMPLELGLILGAMLYYFRKTRGPALPPLVLLALLLALQAFNWFAPPPPTAGPGLYLSALAAFALVTITAMWVGTTRGRKLHLGMRG